MSKILHILATPRAEGTPNLVLDWLNSGQHHQEVFCLEGTPTDLADSLRLSAQWYKAADVKLLTGWRKFPHIARTIWKVCNDRRPDLVICWVTGLSGWVCLGAKFAGVRQLLVHAGNPPGKGWRNNLITWYVTWPLLAFRAKVICCSRYVCDELARIPGVPRRILYAVHNCSRTAMVNERALTKRRTRTHADGPRALMVATLEQHKDHDTLLLSLPRILNDYPSFILELAGDGSLRAKLESRVCELGLGDHVVFLGTRQDIPELLGSSDLFVFSTTEQEGLGSVLLEALAAELPVVASDVPACRELLDDGRWGYLVPARDPNALAEAIINTLANPVDVEGKKQNVKDYLIRFTPHVMMEHYLIIANAS